MMNIAINGFGRIGRSFLRSFLMDATAREKLNIVAINVGPGKVESVAYMFKYDSFMGTLPYEVTYEHGALVVDGLVIPLIAVMNPADAGWDRFGVDWVIEATGAFTTKEKASLHIAGGAKRVLITAPGKQVDVTIVLGVNDDQFDPEKHTIVSLASCTTNALAPMLKVLHEKFGIETAFMNTIHSYTNTQVLLDVEAKDLRESRAATVSIIPSTSGASSAIKEVYPVLTGKISGMSLRVPVGKISIVDLAFTSTVELSKQAINEAFQQARDGQLKNILDSTTLPLVSIDYTNNPHSVIIDELLTDVNGKSAKVFGWYDNEFGYASRLKDFLVKLA
ncbi:type I glyceraldehyde-3-phosphate dehydrogenase [Candidatus Babeliales bacterium]|nr:type I glyceraldehyde-3-phosphate dehydrogenase [Candidatus Babeliales bacterium]MBP9843563.1 type I glyceraldehyde-3-phosphate dehydrogenase [Candidatus Babeliales bacterium]